MERLRRATRIPARWFNRFLEEQDLRCEICRIKFETSSDIQTDHDHKTDKARGLLCRRCNLAIGLFRDDPAIADRAVAYLIRFCKRAEVQYARGFIGIADAAAEVKKRTGLTYDKVRVIPDFPKPIRRARWRSVYPRQDVLEWCAAYVLANPFSPPRE